MKRFIAVITFCLIAISIYAEPRNALLIANGNYNDFQKLANPIPEANNLASTLKKLGFTVTVKTNCSRREMILALSDFKNSVTRLGGIAFFHYGGYAVQINGENYLIPVDAIDNAKVAESDGVELSKVTDAVKGNRNIIILDACRNNPYTYSSRNGQDRGLKPIFNNPPNSIIVYAAQPGAIAKDGVFTPVLTQKITEQKPFDRIIMDVLKEVKRRTNNEQNPGYYTELDDVIYLAGTTEFKEIPTPTVAKVSTTTTTVQYMSHDGYKFVDGIFVWDIIICGSEEQDLTNPYILVAMDELVKYIEDKYDGVVISQVYITMLKQMNMALNSDVDGDYYEIPFDLKKYNCANKDELHQLIKQYLLLFSGNLEKYINDSLEPTKAKMTIMMKDTDSNLVEKIKNDIKKYSDTNMKPMGYEINSYTRTNTPFYISNHEVTQVEYYAITGEQSSRFSANNKSVNKVSWREAAIYCNLLSQKEGFIQCYSEDSKGNWIFNKSANGYRLPTDVELEWVTRSGRKMKNFTYYNEDIDDLVPYDIKSNNDTLNKNYKPELYDMNGNVWVWCWDRNDVILSNSWNDYTESMFGKFCGFHSCCYINANDCGIEICDSIPSNSDGIGFRVVRSAEFDDNDNIETTTNTRLENGGITRVKHEHHEYLKIDEPFRQQLTDGKMIQIKISLGYKVGDNNTTQQELSQILPMIREIVIKHLSSLNGKYFDNENALDCLEEDLLKKINRVLNNGKVERIYFQEFTLM